MRQYLLIVALLSGILLSCGETGNSNATNTGRDTSSSAASIVADNVLFDLFADKGYHFNGIWFESRYVKKGVLYQNSRAV